MIINLSGVDYDRMELCDMVVVVLKKGVGIKGHYRPPSDATIYLELYKTFPPIRGITCTHLSNAVALVQIRLEILILGIMLSCYVYG